MGNLKTAKAIVLNSLKKHERAIEGFKTNLLELSPKAEDVNYHLRWSGVRILEATNYITEMSYLIQVASKDEDNEDEFIACCTNYKKNSRYFLETGSFAPNSTSPMSNLDSICKAKAIGEILQLLKYIETELGKKFD
jgi:hypothetical protein